MDYVCRQCILSFTICWCLLIILIHFRHYLNRNYHEIHITINNFMIHFQLDEWKNLVVQFQFAIPLARTHCPGRIYKMKTMMAKIKMKLSLSHGILRSHCVNALHSIWWTIHKKLIDTTTFFYSEESWIEKQEQE